MKYRNPIISGFYPDPSICRVDNKFYLVSSSFNYFPGVPLFESDDLINWEQIGHVLTRKSQLDLTDASTSGGIYAPTIRFHNGRFYMVTTNVNHGGNFYVWTDDIHGEWSDPIYVDQGGIDPSLYFENDTAYFMSNGEDDRGVSGITQCVIDIETGHKLTSSKSLWQGAGGRYLEGPHLYKIDNYYYLMASEGGTEYGHMLVYARSKDIDGPYESYPNNPVLTNRNLGGYQIQGCGHGDLVDDQSGNWWMVHLGFRQLDQWLQHHITGREVYLVPVKFDQNHWFTAGVNGTTRAEIETDQLPTNHKQKSPADFRFDNTQLGKEWVFLRNPVKKNYDLTDNYLKLKTTSLTNEEKSNSPSMVLIRQCQLQIGLSVDIQTGHNEGGITLYMSDELHYDLAVRRSANETFAFLRLRVGDACQIVHQVKIADTSAELQPISLKIDCTSYQYKFSVNYRDKIYELGSAQTKYLSSEVADNFTGVMIGLYAQQTVDETQGEVVFSNFSYRNLPKKSEA